MKQLFSRPQKKQEAPREPLAQPAGHAHFAAPNSAGADPTPPEPAAPKRKPSAWAMQMRDLLSGEFLIRDGALAQAPYLIFVSFLLVLYVSLGYYYEHLERERQTTERRLQELRAEFKTLQAEFESRLQQSEVEERMAELGLVQPVEAPYLIEVEATPATPFQQQP